MNKEEQDIFFIDIANKFSQLSHCVSIKVGAIAVKDNRIISTGINGTPQGHINCDNVFDKYNFDRNEHHLWSNINEIHAEMNVILYAAKFGISLDGCTLYCNIQPCVQCTKNLIQSGITEIIYEKEYDKNKDNEELVEFIKNCKNIKFKKIGV